MADRVFEAIAATGLPCTGFSQGIEAGSSGRADGGGRGSTLDGPTAGLAAGCTACLTPIFAMGVRDPVPTLVGNTNLHAFPVTKHDLDFVVGHFGRYATYDGPEHETPGTQGEAP